jgi:IclR family acetate operon transcriptional repressor
MRYTNKTIHSAEALRARLEQVRKQGYALDDEEQSLGVRCLAVPLHDLLRKAMGALGISGPLHEIPKENIGFLVACLRRTSAEIALAEQNS